MMIEHWYPGAGSAWDMPFDELDVRLDGIGEIEQIKQSRRA